MHYLQGPIDQAIGKVLHFLVPQHQYKSIHDLFNPQLFRDCLITIISNIPQLTPHLDALISTATIQQTQNLTSSQGFAEVRIKNFMILKNTIATALDYLGISTCRQLGMEEVQKMVKQFELQGLEILLQNLFELLIKHHGAVQYITELPAEDQASIKDFLQRNKPKNDLNQSSDKVKQEEQQQRHRLQDQNNELKHLLNSKESDIQKLTIQIDQLLDNIQQLKELEAFKQNKIQSLNKRLTAYQETDTLFQQKDEQIHKLNKMMNQLQLANRFLTTQLSTQKSKNQQKINDLQVSNADLHLRLDKLATSYDSISKQKEQIELSNKKVISNLKEKIKNLTQRVGQLQNQLVQSKISRQLRERQYNELWLRYETLRSNSNLLQTSQIKHSHPILTSSLTGSQRIHRQCLKQDLIELDKLQQNAFEQQIMMFESSQDNLKKVQEIVAENVKLKQRLSVLQSKQTRQSREENDKLKKRLAVMKKRIDELQTQHKDELQLLVSAFESCLRVRDL